MKPISAPAIAVAAMLLAGPAARAQPTGGDAVQGRALFQQKCAACHKAGGFEGDQTGPALDGVVGRKAGAMADFEYSTAMKAWGMTWTPALLDQFLTKPSALTPGTKMAVMVSSDQDRADVIAFLASLNTARGPR